MKILNIGSINVDHVYTVENFVRPGETISSTDYHIFAGGKGFNQSLALARAGATVYHLGNIGTNEIWLQQQLKKNNVNVTHIKSSEVVTGHAVIQVNNAGENSIILYGGANKSLLEIDVKAAVSSFSANDYLLVQNETSLVEESMRMAAENGLKIMFNPAPMTKAVHDYPLELVDTFFLNETEAEALTQKIKPEEIRSAMCNQFPNASTVLTMGEHGSWYFNSDTIYHQPAESVTVVDTTAAGDTFVGYFLAELMRSNKPDKALAIGTRAAAICITKAGAADSIPFIKI